MNYTWIISENNKIKNEVLLDSTVKEYLTSLINGVWDSQIVWVEKTREVMEYISFFKENKECGTLFNEGMSLVILGCMPLLEKDQLKEFMSLHLQQKNDITIGLKNKKGIFKKDLGGIYLLQNKVALQGLSKFKIQNSLKAMLSYLRKKNKIGYFNFLDNCKLVFTPLELYACREELKKRIIEYHLKRGVWIEDNTVFIGSEVMIEASAKIKTGSRLMGKSIIHSGAEIGPYTELRDTEALDFSNIRNSIVCRSKIGRMANIGPYVNIREATTIDDEARIGNFVELKKAQIGKKTRVSHLSYLGDISCGNGVNIGCGVVTVNYNGKEKQKTIIKDNAFIGCHSSLIAPLTIEKGCYVAAGTVLTKDIEENTFVIGRCEEVVKKNYALKYGYQRYEEEK